MTPSATAAANELQVQFLPGEADAIISSLERTAEPLIDRRATPRLKYRAVAELRLFSDGSPTARVIYTRDVTERGVGFITRAPFP